MVTSDLIILIRPNVEEVAQKTIDCLKAYVPDDLPGVTFLSGGQSDIDATAHLDAMNKIGGFNWKLSFSWKGASTTALKAWMGKKEMQFWLNRPYLTERLMNKLASEGKWIFLEN